MGRRLILPWLLLAGSLQAADPLVPLVDPFIGTTGGGNTYPGAQVPWGLVSVSPHTALTAPSGYLKEGQFLYGFGHVHLSGTGCPDLGNVLVAAAVGSVAPSPDAWKSRLENERASPGAYRTDLASFGITAEATATARVGLLRFTFPPRPNGDARIFLDAGHRLSPDLPAGTTPFLAAVRIVSATEVEGWSDAGNFCGSGTRARVYFAAAFSRPALSASTWNGALLSPATAAAGRDCGVAFGWATRRSDAVLVKVGVSYVSTENARENRETEMPGWDINAVRAAARGAWEKELGRIRVQGGTPDQRIIFYTALYHALIHPNISSDVNGDYPGRTGSPPLAGVRPRYTVFSLWDTYRTVHPLLTLVWPDRQTAMLDSMAGFARDTGALPKWELAGNETRVMVGDPAAIVVADSWLKGLRAFDAPAAWAAARRAGFEPGPLRPGLAAYARYGFLPYDDTGGEWVWGPVSTLQEYALADWHLARWAEGQGLADDARAFAGRSGAWRAVFDPGTGFFRPRLRGGAWLEPFNPDIQDTPGGWSGGGGPGFVEGSAWTYAFSVPQDPAGLIAAHGGPDDFVEHLQAFLDRGSFTLGNEPDFHTPWLFDFVGAEAWRTQRTVREALQKSFRTGPAGLPGNDDAGTTSAWIVWAMLGLYPTCPGSGRYELASPVFDKAEIVPEEGTWPGKKITLLADGAAGANPYIQEATWNRKALDGPHVDHGDLIKGGTLAVRLGPFPSTWGGMPRVPIIRRAPASVRVMEGREARFAVRAGGTGPIEYQWRRAAQDIPGATRPEFIVAAAPRSADRLLISCLVKTPYGRLETPGVTLFVDPDTVPPTVTAVLRSVPSRQTPWTVLTVAFSEPVDPGWARDGANYSMYPVVPMDRIGIEPDGRTVTIELARALDPRVRARLDVRNIRDRAWSPNVMAPARFDILPEGDGLAGEYFANPTLAGPPRRVADPEVDFDWGEGPPLPGMEPDGFSIRWRGRVRADSTGVHTFTVRSDDGARLWVAGARLVDEWHDMRPADHSGTIFLEAGKPVEIWLEYFERSVTAQCRLFWTPPDGAMAIVPHRNLYTR